MAPSCHPIRFPPPCPLDTGTVDGNGWRKLLCPKLFRQPDPLSKVAGQWMPVGQWISPTVVALTAVRESPDPAPGLTERSPTPGRFHFRERVSLAKYSTARRKLLSIMVLRSPSTLPTVLRTWQSGKVLRNYSNGKPGQGHLSPFILRLAKVLIAAAVAILHPGGTGRSLFFRRRRSGEC